MVGSKQRMSKAIKARRAFAIGTVMLLTAGLLVALAAASTTPVLADHDNNWTSPDNWDMSDNGMSDNRKTSDNWTSPDNWDMSDNQEPSSWDNENEWSPSWDNENEWEIGVKEINWDEVEIVARNPSENDPDVTENKFKLKISTKEGVNFESEYTENIRLIDNREVERETDLEFGVRFDAIIEFVDVNGNGLYDVGEEIYEYDLKEAQFDPIQHMTENTGSKTVHAHKITIQTSDGVFKIIVYSSGKPVLVSSENLKPSEVKIEIEINNFPYTHENGKLALRTKLEGEIDTKREKSEAGEKVEIISGDYGGFFSWKGTAQVDGVAKEVKSTAISEGTDGGLEFYLIYEHGSSIVHDPKIGVTGRMNLMIVGLSWGVVIITALVSAFVSVGVTGTLIITHKDADGVCAAAVAKTSYPGAKVDFIDPPELPSKLGSVSGYDRVIVLDLGINRAKKAKTVKAFKNLSKKCSVTYIDHHLFPRGVTRRSLGCDAVVHKTNASASELAWEFFRPPASHDFIALLGAIGDYQDNTPKMQKLIERYTERKAYSEAAALEGALAVSGDGFRQRVTEELFQGKWPLEIRGMESRALRAMRQRSIIKNHVLNSAERVNGCAMFVKDVPFNATGFAAELLTKFDGVDVGIAAGRDDEFIRLSARRGNGSDINLSTLLGGVTSDLGGVGGGHAAAAGGRIPVERFDEFLVEIERHI